MSTPVKSGTEFHVNTVTLGDQNNSAIADLPDGRFVVTWADNSLLSGDPSSSGVVAQIFNADGSLSGTQFLVNTTTANFQNQPAITVLTDGAFVISWTDASNSSGDTSVSAVRAQVFAADGTKAGAEFLVNTVTANFQFHSTLATLSDGRFVAIWTDMSGLLGKTGFHGTGGAELRFVVNSHVLQGDVDGDGISDFTIQIDGTAPVAADFIL